jgi:hypothetical protein
MKIYDVSIKLMVSWLQFMFLLVLPAFSFAQEKFTISGYVTDAENGEALIGATVLVKELGTGNITNVYGYYAITIPSNEYTIEIRYAGYQAQTKMIALTENQRNDIELEPEEFVLEEIVVKAESENQNITSTEVSVEKLDIKTIIKMPAFGGEVDIVKSLQLLPGVSSVGEGASGFNVRGGTVGQNLVLLDEAPVYNSSHLFGFFSVFNPDAVKDVKLYKGGVPAQFGGRASSVLDIRMKEGDSKKMSYSGGLGTVFGRFAVEGPVIKDKASFMVAGRRSWIDGLLKPFDIVGDADQIFFYDLTLKSNYTINENNRIFLSGYFGQDVFEFGDAGFDWGNSTGTLRWNHLVNERLFTNFSLIYSNYNYALDFGDEDPNNSFLWDSRIRTIDFKPQASYFINENNEISFGGEFINYVFEPANAVGISNGVNIDLSLDEKHAREYALYINNKQKLSSRLTVDYGIRLSSYNQLGPGDAFTLEDTEPGAQKVIVDIESFDDGEVIQRYANLEPRLAFTYQFSESSSFKASYNRMAQYIHLLSVSTASNPLDLWTPSTNNIKPEIGNLYTLGYFKNLKNNKYQLSAEAYYRSINNQLDYRNGLSINDLLINEFVERELLIGDARAYGVEFYAKKASGRFNGWLSYTLSNSEIKTPGLNNDTWYATNYDQRHSLKATAFYELTDRIELSANFIYSTGRPYTAMDQKYQSGPYLVYKSSSGDRNSQRLPAYHRLDVSATFDLKPGRLFGRDYTSNLVISLYNLYGRQNAFSIYVNPGNEGIGQDLQPGYNQFSLIGNILPSISYNFKF